MSDNDCHSTEHIHVGDCHDHVHSSVCHQCGKVHSIYFIKEHHCLEETLSSKKENLHEQCYQYFFFTRAPPLLVN